MPGVLAVPVRDPLASLAAPGYVGQRKKHQPSALSPGRAVVLCLLKDSILSSGPYMHKNHKNILCLHRF